MYSTPCGLHLRCAEVKTIAKYEPSTGITVLQCTPTVPVQYDTAVPLRLGVLRGGSSGRQLHAQPHRPPSGDYGLEVGIVPAQVAQGGRTVDVEAEAPSPRLRKAGEGLHEALVHEVLVTIHAARHLCRGKVSAKSVYG